MKILVLNCVIVLLGTALTGSAQEVDRTQVESFVDSALNPLIERGQMAGAVFVFVQNGRVLAAKSYGYADLERKTPVTLDGTLFRVASVSKSFTALAALQLVENGKLRLDDDIGQYLKPLPEPAFPARPITLADLLTHTSGLDDRYIMSGLSSQSGRLAPWTEYVRRGFFHRLAPPGQFWRYSNQNAIIAGYLIEHASAMGFGDYMRSEVLEPLGMTHSTFDQASPAARPVATGYHFQNRSLRALPAVSAGCDPSSSLLATSADMAHFLIMQLAGGMYQGHRLLRPETLRLMQQPQFRMHPHVSGVSFGFWERTSNGLQTWEHAGTGPGFISLAILIPEKHAGIFVSHNSDNYGLLRALIGPFFNRFYPAPISAPNSVRAVPVSDLTRFVGYYRGTGYPASTLDKLTLLTGGHPETSIKLANDGFLHLKMGQREAQLEPEEPLVFRDIRTGDRFGFRADSSGAITHMILPYSPLEKIRFYDRYEFQGSILGAAVVVLLAFVLIWPILAIRSPSVPGTRIRWSGTFTLAAVVSVFELTFLAIAGAAVFQVIQFDFIQGSAPIPAWVRALLALPVGAVVFAIALFVDCCRRPFWSRAARVHSFLVVLAAAALTWICAYWNVLGWRL